MEFETEEKIFKAVLFVPPIVLTILIGFIYGWHNIGMFLFVLLGWTVLVLILMFIKWTLGDLIEERISEYRDRVKLNSLIIETFNFQKKEWYNLPKDIRSNLHYDKKSLDKIKSKIFSTVAESEWLNMNLNEKLSTIESAVLALEKEFEKQQLARQKEAEKRRKLEEQKERERKEREELERKLEDERKKQNEEFEKKQKLIDLEKQKKILEEKRQQDKIARQERIDREYKERIKRDLLRKEREKELASEAIKELEAEGKLSKDHFKKHDRKPIPSHIKQAVWKRDREQCVNCGSQKDLEFDHIVPVSKGGSNSLKNIQLLCLSCNRTKTNKIM
ncbi:MAG: HNH endonuclease [bacterium]|nr:HNH endonuclease [bacterium]